MLNIEAQQRYDLGLSREDGKVYIWDNQTDFLIGDFENIKRAKSTLLNAEKATQKSGNIFEKASKVIFTGTIVAVGVTLVKDKNLSLKRLMAGGMVAAEFKIAGKALNKLSDKYGEMAGLVEDIPNNWQNKKSK